MIVIPLLVIVLGMMVDSDLAVELAPLDYAEIASRNSLVKAQNNCTHTL